MIRRSWFTVGVVSMLWLGVFVPATVFAQHGPGRHGPPSAPAYDTNSEATFTGTVADVKTRGRGPLEWLLRVHTLGLAHNKVQEKQLLLKTDTGTIQIHLGPTAFLTENKLEIGKSDTVEVTGSRVTVGESQVVLAREIRKGDNAWTLRDAAGQPLWRSPQTEARGFWTTKKVLLTVVVIKVVALATVLRH